MLDKLLAIEPGTKRARELQRASMFERPQLQAEISDVFQNPDEHSEAIYEVCCESHAVAHLSRSELQFIWGMCCNVQEGR